MDIRPHRVKATYLVEYETVIDARTPEEAESIFESDYDGELVGDDSPQSLVTSAELQFVEACPAEDDQ